MSQYLDSNGLLYFWQKIKNMFVAKETGKGLSTNDYTTAEKNKLSGIATGANNYSLPTASASVLGGVKVGDNLSIDENGVLSAQDSYVLPTASTDTLGGVKTTSTVSSTSGLTACPIIDGNVYYKDTNTTYNAATTSANGLMSSSDKSKLDAFGAASTYALKTDITGVYKYKGSVTAYSNLPSTGVTTGDVYNVESNGQNYAWTGTAWDSLGEIFQITDISNSDIDTILAS